MSTDPIANMLVSLRNAYQNRFATVEVPFSNQKLEICRVLKETGIIKNYRKKKDKIAIELKDQDIPTEFRRISKPGARIYAKAKQIPFPRTPQGVIVVSTSKGIMSGRAARRRGLGGELICEIN